MANKVQFYSGQSENFKNLETKDNNTLYFLEDTKEIYKGSNKMGSGLVEIEDGSITESKIADGAVTLNKLGNDVVDIVLDSPDSEGAVNLFNPENIIAGYFDTKGVVIDASVTRSGYVKCSPNTLYTIIRNGDLSSRFAIGNTTAIPVVNAPVTNIKFKSTNRTFEYTTDSTAEYIVFFFYHKNHDTETPENYAKNIMIAENTATDFTEYVATKLIKKSILPFDIQAIPEDLASIKEENSAIKSDIESLKNNKAEANNRFNTKNKIYGVQFDLTSNSTEGTRIANATGLSTNYYVGENAVYEAENSFDSIFPWCDIKRCNLIVNTDGTTSITYEGEEGFSVDGTNGDVMVEIPKFYSFREQIDNIETWAISGEPKSGFNIEPAFLDSNGNELDFIYVGAYEFSGTSSATAHSVSGKAVRTASTMAQYRATAKTTNTTCIDYAVIHALQFLWVIEFADRDTDKYMQGFSYHLWFSSGNDPITAISDDRLTVTIRCTGTRAKNFRVGQNVIICQNRSSK